MSADVDHQEGEAGLERPDTHRKKNHKQIGQEGRVLGFYWKYAKSAHWLNVQGRKELRPFYVNSIRRSSLNMMRC